MNTTLKPWGIDVPVLLIFFVRDDVFEKTFAAVKEARPRKLLLWQDGPREGRQDDVEGIMRCRKIAENIDWDCEVYKNYQEKNRGCDPSTFYSHKWAFSLVDKCIILEDDCVGTQSFFKFCKEMLDKYENDLRINRICGRNPEGVTEYCPYDYFYTLGGSVWGWATWKRVADTWDENYLFAQYGYEMRMLSDVQDTDYKPMLKKLKGHIRLGIPFWETINTYARLINHQLVIVPKKNLIGYCGITENATHSAADMSEMSDRARREVTLQAYDISFPLKHPQYTVCDVSYYNRLCRHNVFMDKLQSVCRRLRAGNYKSLLAGFKRFVGLKKLDF